MKQCGVFNYFEYLIFYCVFYWGRISAGFSSVFSNANPDSYCLNNMPRLAAFPHRLQRECSGFPNFVVKPQEKQAFTWLNLNSSRECSSHFQYLIKRFIFLFSVLSPPPDKLWTSSSVMQRIGWIYSNFHYKSHHLYSCLPWMILITQLPNFEVPLAT